MSRLASTLFLIAQSQLTLILPQFIARSEINEMGRLRTDMGTKDFAYSIIESTDFNIVRWTTLYQPLYQLMWAALLPTLTESILSNISCSQIWSMLLRQPKLEEKMLSICRSSMLSAVSSMLTAAACCAERTKTWRKMTIINFIFPSETASISLATMLSISLVLVVWTLWRSTSKTT